VPDPATQAAHTGTRAAWRPRPSPWRGAAATGGRQRLARRCTRRVLGTATAARRRSHPAGASCGHWASKSRCRRRTASAPDRPWRRGWRRPVPARTVPRTGSGTAAAGARGASLRRTSFQPPRLRARSPGMSSKWGRRAWGTTRTRCRNRWRYHRRARRPPCQSSRRAPRRSRRCRRVCRAFRRSSRPSTS